MHLHYDPLREVLVTVGGSEAIDMCIRAIVQPGDEVHHPGARALSVMSPSPS